MYYTIYATDTENSLKARLEARPAHIQRLQSLLDHGRLLVAGANPAVDSEDPGAAGFTGSLIIAQFNTLKDAKEWASADPYIAAGVYANVAVKPYRVALP